MNRKMTPILLSVALVLGLVTYLAEKNSPSDQKTGSASVLRVLDVSAADIFQIRVRRDYWNTFVLKRDPEGTWQITEPSHEPAVSETVNRLLGALEGMTVIATMDMPAADSERHREYGLWEPAAEVKVTSSGGDHTILIGAKTPDGKGVYCAEDGRNRVFVTSADVVKTISTDFAAYRRGGTGSSQPAAPVVTASGLKIEDLTIGTGPVAEKGQKVTVNYEGRLESGHVFDASKRHSQKFSPTLGAGEAIKGWDEGLIGMRVGGKRKLTIPPELGYGASGRPPHIPPNATLIFEIELLSVSPAQ